MTILTIGGDNKEIRWQFQFINSTKEAVHQGLGFKTTLKSSLMGAINKNMLTYEVHVLIKS